MDPVTGIGLVASSAQPCQLAFDVLTNLYRYYRNVKEVPTHSAELRQELDVLVDLRSLSSAGTL